jgi:hypothetical protein
MFVLVFNTYSEIIFVVINKTQNHGKICNNKVVLIAKLNLRKLL